VCHKLIGKVDKTPISRPPRQHRYLDLTLQTGIERAEEKFRNLRMMRLYVKLESFFFFVVLHPNRKPLSKVFFHREANTSQSQAEADKAVSHK